MMRTACTAREDWPRSPYRRACLCQRCRAGTIERLADQSLSAALAHAQNRGEAEAPYLGSSAAEDTIDTDISVDWSPPAPLDKWLPTAPRRPGQFLYKIFLRGNTKPLYIGRVTGGQTSLHGRITTHIQRGRTTSTLTRQNVYQEIARNKALWRSGAKGAKSESQLFDDILKTLGPAAFDISVAAVKRIGLGGGKSRAYGADTALAEKYYHRRNLAWINTRDNPRFEAEVAADSRTDDPALSRLVQRILATSTARSGWAARSKRRAA